MIDIYRTVDQKKGRASLVTQMVKKSDCNAEDLGWEEPLEKGKATYSSILA